MNHDPSDWRSLLDALHASRLRIALVVAGGGTGALAACFRREGASNTFVDAGIPYSRRAMIEYLAAEPVDSSASAATARQLAQCAFTRAQLLDDRDGDFQYAGVALVAALPTTTPRRGSDRIHAAVWTQQANTVWSMELDRGDFTRELAESAADDLFLIALADLAGEKRPVDSKTFPNLRVDRRTNCSSDQNR